MSEQVVTLCDPSDAYAFTIGTRLELAMTTDGRAAAQPPAHDAKAAVADQYRQPSRSSLLTERRALEPIRQRYHWRSLSAVRSPVTAGIDFTVVRECGHRQRFRLFEDELEVLAAGQWIDALFECFDRFNSDRRCSCMARHQ